LEYNLVHAMLGRFGVLIPLLGLFFELGGVISQKELVSKIAGGIVLLGCFIGILAGFTGIVEVHYLSSINIPLDPYKFHIISGGILIFLFTILFIIRIYLYKYSWERTVLIYFFVYTLTVILNLFSNEFITYSIRGN